MVYVPPKLNQTNFWHVVHNVFTARAYIRVPLIIGGAYAWNQYFVQPETEKFYNWWNAGISQKDMWIAVEERTKLRVAGKLRRPGQEDAEEEAPASEE